ncbi:hypothetical protein WHR41_08031 [Cladosporium halotolerans]|uniref:Uncharacterized protein n=1 Tax=Cladosporium halotolerans TaxID=1052096 RepID=A0AB34KJB4_9PEZI
MASKKDMRREELIVPYTEPPTDKDASDFQGTISSTLPMAAIFTRNKMIGWTAVIFAIQGWLGETPAQAAAATTPAYLQVGMAAMSLGVAYMPLFLPPSVGGAGSSSTGPAAPSAA